MLSDEALIVQIRHYHSVQAYEAMVESLLELKSRCPRGQWKQWVIRRLELNYNTVQSHITRRSEPTRDLVTLLGEYDDEQIEERRPKEVILFSLRRIWLEARTIEDQLERNDWDCSRRTFDALMQAIGFVEHARTLVAEEIGAENAQNAGAVTLPPCNSPINSTGSTARPGAESGSRSTTTEPRTRTASATGAPLMS